MNHFCEFEEIKEGAVTGDLVNAYVINTICGKKYRAQVDEQRRFNEEIKNGGKNGGK